MAAAAALDRGLFIRADHIVVAFGAGNFCNEIIWKRSSAHNSARRYGPVHDVILFLYGEPSLHTEPRAPAAPAGDDQWCNNVEPDTGRRFKRDDLTAQGIRTGPSGQWAVTQLDATPTEQRSRDKGVDGVASFYLDRKTTGRVIISVKGGMAAPSAESATEPDVLQSQP